MDRLPSFSLTGIDGRSFSDKDVAASAPVLLILLRGLA
jgi:hypothetical protein